jgi:hypothetical protein
MDFAQTQPEHRGQVRQHGAQYEQRLFTAPARDNRVSKEIQNSRSPYFLLHSPAMPTIQVLERSYADRALRARVGLEPRAQHFFGHIVGQAAIGQAEHIGVVPDASTCDLAGIGAQRSADPADFIRGHADACARPAKENALVAATPRDGQGRLLRRFRPRDFMTRAHRAERYNLVIALLEPLLDELMDWIRFIGAQSDAHAVV